MDIRVVEDKISLAELKELAKETYVDMIKAVVDLDKKIMAVGGEWHADAERVLLDQGSDQKNLWGINLILSKSGKAFVKYTSLINIRPRQNNMSEKIQDKALQVRVFELVDSLVERE